MITCIVEVLNSGYSRDRETMHLLRCLFFIAEHFCMQVEVEAVHLPGKENGMADALSHDNIPRFLQECPGAVKSPTHLPGQALALLVEEQPDRLDITALDRTVCQLYKQGLAQSTQRTYASGKRCYLNFCERLGVRFLKDQGLWHQTVKVGKSWCRVGLHNALDSGVPLFLWFSEVGRGGGAIGQYLSFGDISMNNQANPSDLQVSLKQSKTDPFRNGVKIIIGWAEGPLCLVVAALAYMALRGPGEGTLFRFQDSRFLTRQ